MTSLQSTPTMISNNIRPRYNKDYSNPAVMSAPQNPIRQYRKGYAQTNYEKTNNQRTASMVTQMMDTPGQVQHNNCQGISTTQKVHSTNAATNSMAINKSLRLLRNKPKMTKSYSQNYYQYLQKRCKTYDQCSFNFAFDSNTYDKPGSPLAFSNIYVGNCVYSGKDTKSCSAVVYKPNNFKFAKQGAVSSWLRTNQLADQTVATNDYLQQFCVKL